MTLGQCSLGQSALGQKSTWTKIATPAGAVLVGEYILPKGFTVT